MYDCSVSWVVRIIFAFVLVGKYQTGPKSFPMTRLFALLDCPATESMGRFHHCHIYRR